MAVKQKVVECVPQSGDARLQELQMLLRTLQNIPMEGGLQMQMCRNIVATLGDIHIPHNPKDYMKFIENIKKVQEILTRECQEHILVIVTLKAFYHEISHSDKVLSPAMSIVLQLIHISNIPNAVETILHTVHPPENTKRALLTLCRWLTKWTLTENLSPLTLAFMRGLENQQQEDILCEVTNATLDSMFKLLISPEPRKSVGPIVLYMLPHASHDAFFKIIPLIGKVVKQLHKENSESSLSYLEDVVNVTLNLMERITEYPNLYVPLKKELAPFLPTTDFKQDYSTRPWSDGNHSAGAMYLYLSTGKVGLNNLGNTCYMNSVLQALFMTKPFRNEVLLHDKEMTPLFYKLQSLFALLQCSKRPALSPNDISNLARPPSFLPGHQHDSSEFLGHLLDVLHEQEKTQDQADSHVTTLVQTAFSGRTVSVSRCGQCGTKSERVDNFRELQLSFPSNSDNQSVQMLLDYYLQPEKLSGDNQYHCDVCECLTDGDRVTCIEKAPPRLILTLKHFRYDPASQQRTKLLQRVKLDSHVQLEAGQYELYAAVVHRGSSVDSGHYYTFAKDGDDWFKFNDCVVTASLSDELCSLKPPETPYILFYSRQDSVDPEGLPRSVLSHRLQTLISKDLADFEVEQRKSSLRSYNNGKENKNDEPPPPGCGGGGFSSNSSNMYVC